MQKKSEGMQGISGFIKNARRGQKLVDTQASLQQVSVEHLMSGTAFVLLVETFHKNISNKTDGEDSETLSS